jgi:hypothetical protein
MVVVGVLKVLHHVWQQLDDVLPVFLRLQL